MNSTHYCSKCNCYHADVPCTSATNSSYKVYDCPTCLTSPCRCPDYAVNYEDWQRQSYEDCDAHDAELERVQRAIDETLPKLQPKFNDLDVELFRRALGVLL